MDLHYSQTSFQTAAHSDRFHYLMDLHYSQTWPGVPQVLVQFHYLMDLHYSQTIICVTGRGKRFTTLWIYTILKRWL